MTGTRTTERSTGRPAPVLLVVAKAPVPGTAKTRLQRAMPERDAAEIAAACLLDTLEVVAAAPAAERVVAMTGDLRRAVRHDEIVAALQPFAVVAQRGATFAERLAAAHLDAVDVASAEPLQAVVQVGMDTPQLTVEDLARADRALDDHDAVLGPAEDGGWWLLGLRAASVLAGGAALRDVAMSRSDTHARTAEALGRAGLRVGAVRALRDLDEPEDLAAVVAAGTVGGRLAIAAAGHLGVGRTSGAIERTGISR